MSVYLLIDNLPKDIEYPKVGKISKLVKWCIDNKIPILAGIIYERRKIEVGDMLAFRDELIEAGFKLWKDFSIKKLED